MNFKKKTNLFNLKKIVFIFQCKYNSINYLFKRNNIINLKTFLNLVFI